MPNRPLPNFLPSLNWLIFNTLAFYFSGFSTFLRNPILSSILILFSSIFRLTVVWLMDLASSLGNYIEAVSFKFFTLLSFLMSFLFMSLIVSSLRSPVLVYLLSLILSLFYLLSECCTSKFLRFLLETLTNSFLDFDY